MLTINMNGDANLKWGLLLGIAWTSKLNTRNQKIKHRGQYSKTLSSIYKWWELWDYILGSKMRPETVG